MEELATYKCPVCNGICFHFHNGNKELVGISDSYWYCEGLIILFYYDKSVIYHDECFENQPNRNFDQVIGINILYGGSIKMKKTWLDEYTLDDINFKQINNTHKNNLIIFKQYESISCDVCSKYILPNDEHYRGNNNKFCHSSCLNYQFCSNCNGLLCINKIVDINKFSFDDESIKYLQNIIKTKFCYKCKSNIQYNSTVYVLKRANDFFVFHEQCIDNTNNYNQMYKFKKYDYNPTNLNNCLHIHLNKTQCNYCESNEYEYGNITYVLKNNNSAKIYHSSCIKKIINKILDDETNIGLLESDDNIIDDKIDLFKKNIAILRIKCIICNKYLNCNRKKAICYKQYGFDICHWTCSYGQILNKYIGIKLCRNLNDIKQWSELTPIIQKGAKTMLTKHL